MYRRADAFVGDIVCISIVTPPAVVSAYGGSACGHSIRRWLGLEGLIGRATVTPGGGIALTPAGREVEEHLVARLTAELDPATKAPIVAAVYKREDIYSGPRTAAAPDLQVGLAPGYRLGEASSVVVANRRKWSADHASLDYNRCQRAGSSRPTTSETPGWSISRRPCCSTRRADT
jgi:hypothetical protein